MRLRSTLFKPGISDPGYVTFTEAVYQGLAMDGGLFEPADGFDLSAVLPSSASDLPFWRLGAAVLSDLLADELPAALVSAIMEQAFFFEPTLSALTDEIAVLNLFSGPTLAFKDYGAGFLAHFIEATLQQHGDHATILVATSGDTGSAVAQAFHNRHGIDVVLLYPSGRVSPLQEKQLTTLGGNVRALEVNGSFDDCQGMVKAAFADRHLQQRFRLTSANSINIGRLLPQMLYYLFALQKTDRRRPRFFCVPSGNYGNLTAGVLAWKWGADIAGFIASSNANDVVPAYLSTGVYAPRASVPTVSNAMDVGNPSNFERLRRIFNDDRSAMTQTIYGDRVEDAETLRTIARYRKNRGVFLDPHTANGVRSAERFLEEYHGIQQSRSTDFEPLVIVLGTAHPAKFVEVVHQATGEQVPLPPTLADCLDKPKQATLIEPTVAALERFLVESLPHRSSGMDSCDA